MSDHDAQFDSYAHKRPLVGGSNFFLGQHIASDQVSREGLLLIWNSSIEVLNNKVPGAFVEFGCYIGTTSLYLRRLLDEAKQSTKREFHVYDSFEGLPEKVAQDTSPVGADFKEGALAVHKKEFIEQFRKADLALPRIHKAWFANLTDEDIPNQIAFAFLDGDFYGSILASLRLVWPRLSSGGIIVIDDYGQEALPGVKRAVSDFFQAKRLSLRHEHNSAIIRKP
jgi:O-methyltransferase